MFCAFGWSRGLQAELMERDMRLIDALRELKRDKETIMVAYRLKELKGELKAVKDG